MKNYILIIIGLFLIISERSCNFDNSPIEFEIIEIQCIDAISNGGIFTQRIDNQDEYDSLIYNFYSMPLIEWLENNYNSLVDGVIQNYPDATPDEYDSIILNEYIYNFAPYSYVKDCTFPSIDFDKYTLLGKSILSGGCSAPKIENQIYKNENEIIFYSYVETYGNCEMLIGNNEWVLIDKLGDRFEVTFKTEIINQE